MKMNKRLGNRIKEIRKSQKLSQEQLAEKAGTAAKYLSSIETGKENPTFDLLMRIAKALQVEPHQLYLFVEESPYRLRKKIERTISKVPDEDLPRIVRVLEALVP